MISVIGVRLAIDLFKMIFERVFSRRFTLN